MPKHPLLLTLAALLTALFMAVGCSSRPSGGMGVLATADSLMESRPDSALRLLRTVDPSELRRGEESARYALLMSMALDKNYIDTTTFDILRPAIDYYLRKGTPDERLRTLYYQGVIHLNRLEDEEAMNSFMGACDLRNEITDSIVLARTLTGISTLYYKQYKISELIKVSLEAADIYKRLGKDRFVMRSYAKVINGYNMLNNPLGADSILPLCECIVDQSGEGEDILVSSKLACTILFGNPDDIIALLDTCDISRLSYGELIDVARGYSKIGNTAKALELSDMRPIPPTLHDTHKYTAVRTEIYETAGDYRNAYHAWMDFYTKADKYQMGLMRNDILFAEKKHQIELANLKNMQRKDRIILISLSGAFALLLLLSWVYYRRALAAKEIKRLEAARCAVSIEAERLENERVRLSELLDEQIKHSGVISNLVKTRIDILNGQLAREISSNEKLDSEYRTLIDSFRNDRNSLLSFVRSNLAVSRPHFITYLEDHGLSEDEINYVCLCAIGLNGKEIGVYMQIKRLYGMSSEIRRKLRLNSGVTNLGNYIRSLIDKTV